MNEKQQATLIQFLFGGEKFFYKETRKNGKIKIYESIFKRYRQIRRIGNKAGFNNVRTTAGNVVKLEKIYYNFNNLDQGKRGLCSLRKEVFDEIKKKDELIESIVLRLSTEGLYLKHDIEWDGYGTYIVSMNELRRIYKKLSNK